MTQGTSEKRARGMDRGADEVEVVGLPRHPVGDVYRSLLEARWRRLLALFAATYLAVNAAFALLFVLAGGVAGMRPGSFEDAFFFSVQTFGTIGYGAMAPATRAAHLLVTLESMVGIVLLAMVTGIVFSKFARPSARVMFTDCAVITPVDGAPTLMFRAANQHGSYVVEAEMTLWLIRPEVTREGQSLYRTYELRLERSRSPIFNRTWTLMHRIDAGSPLHGATPDSIKDWELAATLVGLDPTSGQSIHAAQSYYAEEIRFGMRHADMLTPLPGERYRIDYTQFDQLTPTEPTVSFPYPPR